MQLGEDVMWILGVAGATLAIGIPLAIGVLRRKADKVLCEDRHRRVDERLALGDTGFSKVHETLKEIEIRVAEISTDVKYLRKNGN